jgi:maleylacetoacetate isomerase
MKLYHYSRSSTSYRVRIALNLKNIPCELVDIHLLNKGGEHNRPDYLKINPQGLVPCLELDEGLHLNQSLAIIEYLDETYPQPALLPTDPLRKAQIRALSLIIACDIHPLNNLRVLNHLKTRFSAEEQDVLDWYHRWLKTGLDAFEAQLQQLERSKPFCYGNAISLADVCLIPQVYNAHRYKLPMDKYPLINEINAYCLGLDAFKKASPELYQ